MASKAEFVNEVYQAALEAGLTEPAARVTASQAALESDYGKRAPDFNYFGIKAGKSWDGQTNKLTTHEVLNGKRVKIKDDFRAYDSPAQAISDRINFMETRFPGFNQSATVGAALDTLQNGVYGKYYTAPQHKYESAINAINTQLLGGNPVPPLNIPNGNVTGAGSVGRGAVPPPLPPRRPEREFKPLPSPAPLAPPVTRVASASLPKLPQDAMYGVSRLTNGQRATLPEDFETNTGGANFRALSMTTPQVSSPVALAPVAPQSLPGMLGRGTGVAGGGSNDPLSINYVRRPTAQLTPPITSVPAPVQKIGPTAAQQAVIDGGYYALHPDERPVGKLGGSGAVGSGAISGSAALKASPVAARPTMPAPANGAAGVAAPSTWGWNGLSKLPTVPVPIVAPVRKAPLPAARTPLQSVMPPQQRQNNILTTAGNLFNRTPIGQIVQYAQQALPQMPQQSGYNGDAFLRAAEQAEDPALRAAFLAGRGGYVPTNSNDTGALAVNALMPTTTIDGKPIRNR